MIEEWLLDDPAALTRADEAGVLLDLASAGATVRRALRLAGEAGLDQLRPEGRPRAAFVAGHGTAALAGQLLAALAGPAGPVVVLRPTLADPAQHSERGDAAEAATPAEVRSEFTLGLDWVLPGWAGPSDLLLLLSTRGTEPGLVALAQRAYARGCSVVSVAPAHSPLAGATVQVRGMPLPFEPSATEPEPPTGLERDLPYDAPSALWGLLAPALALADRVGLASVPYASLQAVADQLDEAAVRCRPAADTYSNPAKGLAVQIDDMLPLLWSDGPGTAAVAERFARMLADHAGHPAITGVLPEALTTQRGLLLGHLGADPDEDDFFRDRTEQPDGLQLKIFLLRRTPATGPAPASPAEEAAAEAEPLPPPYAVARAHRLASDHQIGIQELTAPHADLLGGLIELVAMTDFGAVYLGLAASARSRAH